MEIILTVHRKCFRYLGSSNVGYDGTQVTYVAGPVKSTVDYIMVRQEDKAKVRNVKVISSEECVPKHKLLDMNMWFNATKTWHRKFKPRVRVSKLKEEKTCEEYRSMVGDKVEEAKWKGLCVNDH